MEYRIRSIDDVISYDVKSDDNGCLTVTTADRTREVKYDLASPHHLHLIVDGQGVNAHVAPDGDGKVVIIRGVPYYLEDADKLSTVKKSNQTVPTDITPPMPSTVVAVLVAEGDRVEAGDRVVVVSAMKMETTLTAPYGGTVTAVHVAEGDKVMPGKILVDVEKDEESPDSE
jgi:biotin carboxyl carrier protein